MNSRTFTLLLLGVVGPSYASTININVTRDLLTHPSGWTVSLGAPVSIANGDQVVHTIDFAGSQTLTLGGGGEYLWMWLTARDNNSSFTINNIILTMLGFSGTGGAVSSHSFGSQTTGQAHIGPQMAGFLSAGQTATFTGLQLTYDVQSISQSPHLYHDDWFFFGGAHAAVGGGGVPDSASSLLLLGIGLASLGFARLRRQA